MIAGKDSSGPQGSVRTTTSVVDLREPSANGLLQVAGEAVRADERSLGFAET
jgi:hypothetical protein